jgi:protein tyrosine phosphatase
LPTLRDKRRLELLMRGPTNESNWVIPGHLLCGSQPDLDLGDSTREGHQQHGNLGALLRCNVRVFVCLQTEAADIPYKAAAMQLANIHPSPHTSKSLEFICLPIKDGGIFDDYSLFDLVQRIIVEMRSGKLVYVHCRGGHGRTGVVVACVLGLFYPHLSSNQVLQRIQCYHDTRLNCLGELLLPPSSPQTLMQHAQVKRILAKRSCNLVRLASLLCAW